MNRVFIKAGEEIYLQNENNIKYNIFIDTPIFINNKVYFTDNDNFFHFKTNTNLLIDIEKFIKEIFNTCQILEKDNIINNNDITNLESKDLSIKLQKGTIIKMNDIPITIAMDMNFFVKPNTKFIISENNNLEIVSRNNIINIINKETLDVKYSKVL
jgi:hypothetical protein